ncbi:hypothetical protein JXB41_06085 [Candidatus Woesearchaeota archaeon]|nr:hypothetical protein [Candidatus Woesearchaeota archaeon]
MIEAQNVNMLAETLRKTGLVASATEAMRLARNIACTEKKVTQDFDNKKSIIDKSLERRKYNSKQEEINDLIEKTDFNKKDYFVPVKGYQKEEIKADEIVEEEKIEIKQETEIKKKPSQKPETRQLKPVHTDDLFSGDKTLKEIMDEDAGSIYSKPETAPEFDKKEEDILSDVPLPVTDEREEPEENTENQAEKPNEYNLIFYDDAQETGNSSSREKEVEASSENDEFIIDVEENPNEESILDSKLPESRPENQPSAGIHELKTEQITKAHAVPEKPKEFKNPLPEVNLMDHFNFGKR